MINQTSLARGLASACIFILATMNPPLPSPFAMLFILVFIDSFKEKLGTGSSELGVLSFTDFLIVWIPKCWGSWGTGGGADSSSS